MDAVSKLIWEAWRNGGEKAVIKNPHFWRWASFPSRDNSITLEPPPALSDRTVVPFEEPVTFSLAVGRDLRGREVQYIRGEAQGLSIVVYCDLVTEKNILGPRRAALGKRK